MPRIYKSGFVIFYFVIGFSEYECFLSILVIEACGVAWLRARQRRAIVTSSAAYVSSNFPLTLQFLLVIILSPVISL